MVEQVRFIPGTHLSTGGGPEGSRGQLGPCTDVVLVVLVQGLADKSVGDGVCRSWSVVVRIVLFWGEGSLGWIQLWWLVQSRRYQ